MSRNHEAAIAARHGEELADDAPETEAYAKPLRAVPLTLPMVNTANRGNSRPADDHERPDWWAGRVSIIVTAPGRHMTERDAQMAADKLAASISLRLERGRIGLDGEST